ncbi:MAG: HD family phosphohydrolase, partial [Leptospira sp.]|nr:HD family phosphohydrolase [Leptospira sp.]
MKKFWEHPDVTMAGLTDVLTKVRPVSFVRKLQLGLVMITLAMVTYFLAVPFFGQKGVDLSKEGPFPIGKISSETILSSKEIVYDNEEKTRAEQLKAYQSAPYVFDRDYTVLTGQIQSYVSEDIENLKQVTTTEKAANVFSAILQKNIRWRNRSREDIDILVRYPRKERIKELINQCTGILFSSYCISKEIHPEMNSILNSGARVRNKGSKENVSTLDGSSVFPRSYIYNNPE